MGLVFLDSSFLIATLSPKDIHHRSAIDAYSNQHQYAISVISLIEVLALGRAKEQIEVDHKAIVTRMKHVVEVDQDIAMAAAQIRLTTGLKTPDSIIAASAQRLKAQLWTFDKQLAAKTAGSRLIK